MLCKGYRDGGGRGLKLRNGVSNDQNKRKGERTPEREREREGCLCVSVSLVYLSLCVSVSMVGDSKVSEV